MAIRPVPHFLVSHEMTVPLGTLVLVAIFKQVTHRQGK